MAFTLRTFDAPANSTNTVPTAQTLRAAAARAVLDPRSHRIELMNQIGAALGIPPGGWSHGISRLLDQGEVRVYWLLRVLAGKRASENAVKNLQRAQQFVNAETMLTLITASREHSPSVTDTSDNSIDTYGQGGLDYLGAEMHTLGLPRSITSQWEARLRSLNLESNAMIRPATIPAKDQVLAYAAQLNASFDQRFKSYLRDCIGTASNEAIERTPRAALLAWKSYAFLAPGGEVYNVKKPLSSQMGQRFGIRTCLQFIKSVDERMPLELLITDSRFNHSEWIRIAKVRTAEALFLERILSTTRALLVPTI
jgi:hypothetical protein